MGAATIFNGPRVKSLKKEHKLGDGASRFSGTVDPTSTAVDAVRGSLYQNETTGDLYKKLDDGSSTNWEIIGAGGSSGRNYIENGRAEVNTTGWTRYANTSAANKPDNFGGTPNGSVTWTRFTLTPEYDTASFLFTKDASNRQGEGVYYDFDLEVGDLHSAMTALAKATTNSGYDDGDMRIYLVSSSDSFVADFNVLEFAPTEILAGAHGDINTQVQTDATDTEYRLCFHVASTNATAYTVVLDDIEFKKSARNFGTVGTDWQDYTPTGAWTTNTTYTGRYRRVGDSMEVEVLATLSGAPNTASFSATIPSGFTIDTTKIESTQSANYTLGITTARDISAAAYTGYVRYGGTTGVLAVAQQAGTTYANAATITPTVPFTFASGDTVLLTFRVPILGWSSTVQMSDRDDGRVTTCHAYLNSAQTITTAAQTTIDLDTASHDTHSMFDSGTSRIIIPYSGYYVFYFGGYVSGNTDDIIRAGVLKNGSIAFSGNDFNDASSPSNILNTANASPPIWCAANDYLELFVAGNTDTSYTAIAGQNNTYLAITKVQGPSAIAASEVVACDLRGDNTTTQAFTSGSTAKITVLDAFDDSHGGWSEANDKYIVPFSGWYSISFSCRFFNSDNDLEYVSANIYVDNAQLTDGTFDGTGTSDSRYKRAITDKLIRLNKGAEVEFYATQANQDGDAVNVENSSVQTYASIAKIGGV